MKTLTCKQHSTEWETARLGLVTASEADALISPTFEVRKGLGVETYLYEKLSEKILGYKLQSGGTFEMGQGTASEEFARSWFSFEYNTDVKEVGFIIGDCERIGCSPDGILPDGTGLEIKCPQGPRQLKYYVKNEVPPEYRVQVAFSLYVTKAPYWTFVSYHRALPPLVVKVERNEKEMAAIREALAKFFAQFDPIYARIKSKLDAENAAKEAAYLAANKPRTP